MIEKDKSRLLRRNTMRGRLIVTQRHRAEIIWNFVDSPDRENAFGERTTRSSLRESSSCESFCGEPPHGAATADRIAACQLLRSAASIAARRNRDRRASREPSAPNDHEEAC
jgi:hypothetical protein